MLEACPCWKSRNSTNERAVAGTLAHKMTETGEDDNRLSDEDVIAVAECLDFVETRKNEFRKVWPDKEIFEEKESYLPIDDCVFADCKHTTAGYVDHVLLNWDRTYADIIDWKFGRYAVEKAEDNLQGLAYTLGLFKKYPSLKVVSFFFKQPHIDYVTHAMFKREDIAPIYLRIQAVVARARLARTKNDFSMATPMVPACNFCDNLGACPIGLANALKIGKKFSPLDFPEDITPTRVMDPQNTVLALNLAAVMKTWAEAFRRCVTDRVLRRDAAIPPGMHIQSMPGRREITDMERFREIALHYVSEKDYSACLNASFTPIEEKIAETAPRGSKKATVEAFQKTLEESGAVKRGDGFSFLKYNSGKEKAA